MTAQTIESRDIKIVEVFQDFYEVPDYQREYVWEEEHVEQLLSDINAERIGSQDTDAPEYFIGSIVVCPKDKAGDVLQLIDGQQRITTIFLILCAIRDCIKRLGVAPSDALSHQISATSVDSLGRDVFRYRLDLQYEDSRGILKDIAKGNFEDAEERETRSISNIRYAYKGVLEFFSGELGNNADEIRAFYGYLINKVKLIRIETRDVAKALKIFEAINDRGVGLDSMDLLKNLLFMKAKQSDFENLKDGWKKIQDIIYGMKEKPLRFLRYHILSHYKVDDIVREADIYNWFVENEDECGYATKPLGFVDSLILSARAYKNFLAGHDQKGGENTNLEDLRLLGGGATRQHLILLLAGCKLPIDLFDRFVGEVEKLLFVYLITQEPTRELERNFARWAVEVRDITTKDKLDNFIETRFLFAKEQLSARFNEEWKRLSTDTVKKYRLRYILAKLAQYIDRAAYGDNESTRLRSYLGQAYQIEHIFPLKPNEEAQTEFGHADDPHIAGKLGNLVLVEEAINKSLGNKPYSEKRPVYKKSRLLLTKSLSEKPQIGVNTKINVAVRDIPPFPDWNQKAVVERQNLLGRLAREVWGLPRDSFP